MGTVNPEESKPAYAPLSKDIDLVLCVKEKRVADNGGVFSFHGKLFKLTGNDVPAKAQVEVAVSAENGIAALYKGKSPAVTPYIKPAKVSAANTEKKTPSALGHHSHGNRLSETPRYSYDLAYSEIRKMLEDIFLSKYA